ncbi:hypothetical protein JAAARDRAFT_36166 [Jaapia argillacea MUCL 33604]|uniref:Hyaluronan/mRNA-binding protein domain-containing protein n=1 Tax=Jaapia argillacea MUCL 33604 TaxID=933084 RepID=A0A067Q245_9AGAM|nr:hypothetical protein JAAARDRAFT_36166 [Jaapia argillacea MUCL 33604]
MTRTERSAFPRAISKDRSESKSGLNKSDKKHGGGAHNWGSVMDEREFESGGIADEEREFEEDIEGTATRAVNPERERPSLDRSPSSLNEEEIANAKQIRKNALKGDVDLATIARTSVAVSTSPPNKTVPVARDADTSTLDSASSTA